MKTTLLSRKSKIVVDILLITLLVLTFVSGETEAICRRAPWLSYHCILGTTFVLAILLHLWQHWNFMKALLKQKVLRKNITIALLSIVFVLIVVSILSYLPIVPPSAIWGHHLVGKLVCLIAIIHLVQKWKRLLGLFAK